MSRAALRLLLCIAIAGPALGAGSLDPHVNPSLLTAGCSSCHQGHGVSRSPMLPGSQQELCLSCHGTQSDRDAMVLDGVLDANATPQLLSSTLSLPFVHPIDEDAFSRHEDGKVTCTSCHAAHRGVPRAGAELTGAGAGLTGTGTRRLSPRDPSRLEYELCEGCHGSTGAAVQAVENIGGLLDPRNRSYHPVKAPSVEGSRSLIAGLAGREIDCGDCHGNSVGGSRGPHGSAVRFLLNADYATVDGAEESADAYALCYACHDRAAVLQASDFPGHELHVVEERIVCGTCHNPHGSQNGRALIRFGERPGVAAVSPSATTGRLVFESDAPGAGSCHLTCHGYDHGPATYGPGGIEVTGPGDPEIRLRKTGEGRDAPRRGKARRPRKR